MSIVPSLHAFGTSVCAGMHAQRGNKTVELKNMRGKGALRLAFDVTFRIDGKFDLSDAKR